MGTDIATFLASCCRSYVIRRPELGRHSEQGRGQCGQGRGQCGQGRVVGRVNLVRTDGIEAALKANFVLSLGPNSADCVLCVRICVVVLSGFCVAFVWLLCGSLCRRIRSCRCFQAVLRCRTSCELAARSVALRRAAFRRGACRPTSPTA